MDKGSPHPSAAMPFDPERRSLRRHAPYIGVFCEAGNKTKAGRVDRRQRRHKSPATTGYRGVSYMATSGAWGAWIKVNGKSRFLGRFASKESAHQAYCIEARKAFGEFAKV